VTASSAEYKDLRPASSEKPEKKREKKAGVVESFGKICPDQEEIVRAPEHEKKLEIEKVWKRRSLCNAHTVSRAFTTISEHHKIGSDEEERSAGKKKQSGKIVRREKKRKYHNKKEGKGPTRRTGRDPLG